MKIEIPYGRGTITADVKEERVAAVIHSGLDEYVPEAGEEELIRRAMRSPKGCVTLREMAVGKKKVVILASDHTRPVPSRQILPLMLDEIRTGNPGGGITILIATGCHRGSSREELIHKFGREIVDRERIVIHDCDGPLTCLGVLPSGNEMWINSLAAQADLLVAEGFIEPHFFAGYSGGRKSVLPGVAGRRTIYENHCAQFIAHRNARYGVLRENPIHEEMVCAARMARLAYIVNVVINSSHRVIGAFAGDMEGAHQTGVQLLDRLCRQRRIPGDIVVVSNNGYPLDQNIYQSVKGMAAAVPCVKEKGVIVMAAACNDGCGGEAFHEIFRSAASPEEVLRRILKTKRHETQADQWQAQILAGILARNKVILISDCDRKLVEEMHMIYARGMEDALAKAEKIAGRKASVTFLPEGMSAITE